MSGKPWSEPGLSVEERAERAWRGVVVSSNPDDYVAAIAEALRAARADALEEAARFLTDRARQDRSSVRQDVLYTNAGLIRALKDAP